MHRDEWIVKITSALTAQKEADGRGEAPYSVVSRLAQEMATASEKDPLEGVRAYAAVCAVVLRVTETTTAETAEGCHYTVARLAEVTSYFASLRSLLVKLGPTG